MTGWPFVWMFCAALVVTSLIGLRMAVRGWRSGVAVAALYLPAMLTLSPWIGDAALFLPGWLFADGIDGKDQIVVASAASTLLGGIILASVVVWVVRAVADMPRKD